jgi:hypothetical protein
MTAPLTENVPRDIVDTIPKPTSAVTAVPLTLADRCCACASGTSQAFVRVSILSSEGNPSELLFCGHHYAKHEAALASRDTVLAIHDQRDRINERPSVSANAQ